MTDYLTDLMTYYVNINDLDNDDLPIIDCWEISDWIKEVCDMQNINDFVKEYVDFTEMLLHDDDLEIFVRREDGTFEDIGYFIPSRSEWNKVAKKWIDTAPDNTIFVLRAN